jgi:hypothetical protein
VKEKGRKDERENKDKNKEIKILFCRRLRAV